MSFSEAPELTGRQRSTVHQLRRDYRGYNLPESDFAVITADLDDDIQAIGGVVCRLQIANILNCIASNRWYGDIVLAAAERETISLEGIREYKVRAGVKRGNRSVEEVMRRVTPEETEKATEMMRMFGLLNRTPEGDYRLSPAALREWTVFEDSYTFWNQEQKPPTPVLRQTEGKV